MRKARFSPIDRVCPKCGAKDNQVFNGHTKSGSQRCKCNYCKAVYNLEPKKNGYPEEFRDQAIRDHFEGMSGRAIGRKYGMGNANVYNWLKKKSARVDKSLPSTGGM